MLKLLCAICAMSLAACSGVSPQQQIKAQVLQTCPKPPAHPPMHTLPKAGSFSANAANDMRDWLK